MSSKQLRTFEYQGFKWQEYKCTKKEESAYGLNSVEQVYVVSYQEFGKKTPVRTNPHLPHHVPTFSNKGQNFFFCKHVDLRQVKA